MMYWRTVFAAGALALIGGGEAHAQSAGCAAWNAATTLPFDPGPLSYDVGDRLTVTYSPPGPIPSTADISIRLDGAAKDTVFFPAVPTSFATFTVTASGLQALTATGAAGDIVTFACSPGTDSAGIAAQTAALATTTATVTRIGDRISDIFAANAVRNTEGTTGSAGQAAGAPMGVWAAVDYSGLSDSSLASRTGTDVLTGVAGVDMAPADNIVFGVAGAVSWADTDTPGDAFLRDEVSVTVAPYAALAIDDILSVDGSVGYGFGFSETDRSGVTGDAVNHRYFIAANASARRYWGQFGMFANIGLLWSQNFAGAYTESDGRRVDGETITLGAVEARIEPSYLLPVSDSLTVEPFARLGYSHDYARTEFAGASGDRGQMNIGGGVNLFGDEVFGAVEANTGLFRENQRSLNLNGSVRVRF